MQHYGWVRKILDIWPVWYGAWCGNKSTVCPLRPATITNFAERLITSEIIAISDDHLHLLRRRMFVQNFNDNPSNSCWDIWVCTKLVDWLTFHPKSHDTSVVRNLLESRVRCLLGDTDLCWHHSRANLTSLDLKYSNSELDYNKPNTNNLIFNPRMTFRHLWSSAPTDKTDCSNNLTHIQSRTKRLKAATLPTAITLNNPEQYWAEGNKRKITQVLLLYDVVFMALKWLHGYM